MVYGSEEREIPHTTIVDILVYMNKRPCKKNIPFVLFSQKPLLHNTAVPLPLLHNLFPFYFTKTIPFVDLFFFSTCKIQTPYLLFSHVCDNSLQNLW